MLYCPNGPRDISIGRDIAVYSHLSIDKSTIQIDTGLSYEEACLLEIRIRGWDNNSDIRPE